MEGFGTLPPTWPGVTRRTRTSHCPRTQTLVTLCVLSHPPTFSHPLSFSHLGVHCPDGSLRAPILPLARAHRWFGRCDPPRRWLLRCLYPPRSPPRRISPSVHDPDTRTRRRRTRYHVPCCTYAAGNLRAVRWNNDDRSALRDVQTRTSRFCTRLCVRGTN
jgi:hypothetical protein